MLSQDNLEVGFLINAFILDLIKRGTSLGLIFMKFVLDMLKLAVMSKS